MLRICATSFLANMVDLRRPAAGGLPSNRLGDITFRSQKMKDNKVKGKKREEREIKGKIMILEICEVWHHPELIQYIFSIEMDETLWFAYLKFQLACKILIIGANWH
uniref:Uncharacterized protein n=1 Tax=Romanomermis culicivorax TaxID=13658 RepID=A0A915K5K7_ROMCU